MFSVFFKVSISPSFLKETDLRLTSNLRLTAFFLSKLWGCHSLFCRALSISVEKSAMRLMIVSFRQWYLFWSFFNISVCLWHSTKRKLGFKFYYDVLRCSFLYVFPGVNDAPWICSLMPFVSFRKLLGIISSNSFYVPLSLSSLSGK